MSATTFLAKAATQIGWREKAYNVTPYWADLKPEWQGQPYCAAGLSWVATKTGENQILPNTQPVYYCPSIEAYAKSVGRWYTSPRAGDWVLFSFGQNEAIHVGVVEKVFATTIQTIEFNTSSGNGGSQNNGDGVFRRVRPRAWGIRGYYRPAYKAAPKPPAAPAPTSTTKPQQATPKNLALDGDFGSLTITALNRLTGRGTSTSWDLNARRLFQKWLGVAPDGIIGRLTVIALQKKIGASVDGAWGKGTTTALQRYLNAR